MKKNTLYLLTSGANYILYHAPARAVFVPIEGSCVSFWWVAPLLRRLAHELYLVFSWQTQCWVDHGLTFNIFMLFLGNYIICAGTATEKLYRLGELLHYLGFLILNRISEGTQCLGLHWSPVGLSCLCICQVVAFRRCNDTTAHPSLFLKTHLYFWKPIFIQWKFHLIHKCTRLHSATNKVSAVWYSKSELIQYLSMRMNHYCTKQIFQLGLAKDHTFSVFFGTLSLVSNGTKVLNW